MTKEYIDTLLKAEQILISLYYEMLSNDDNKAARELDKILKEIFFLMNREG